MCHFSRLCRIALFLTLVACLLSGCGEDDSAIPTTQSADQVRGPHGGSLVEVGYKFAYLELLLDKPSGKLTLFSLDGQARKFVRLKQEKIEMSVVIPGRGSRSSSGSSTAPPLRLVLTAQSNELAGEKAGDSSEFSVLTSELEQVESFSGSILQLETSGQMFREVPLKFSGAY